MKKGGKKGQQGLGAGFEVAGRRSGPLTTAKTTVAMKSSCGHWADEQAAEASEIQKAGAQALGPASPSVCVLS